MPPMLFKLPQDVTYPHHTLRSDRASVRELLIPEVKPRDQLFVYSNIQRKQTKKKKQKLHKQKNPQNITSEAEI